MASILLKTQLSCQRLNCGPGSCESSSKATTEAPSLQLRLSSQSCADAARPAQCKRGASSEQLTSKLARLLLRYGPCYSSRSNPSPKTRSSAASRSVLRPGPTGSDACASADWPQNGCGGPARERTTVVRIVVRILSRTWGASGPKSVKPA